MCGLCNWFFEVPLFAMHIVWICNVGYATGCLSGELVPFSTRTIARRRIIERSSSSLVVIGKCSNDVSCLFVWALGGGDLCVCARDRNHTRRSIDSTNVFVAWTRRTCIVLVQPHQPLADYAHQTVQHVYDDVGQAVNHRRHVG
jgi:hypothetical protein